MVQTTIVLLTVRLTQIQERPAQEFVLDLAGEFAGSLGCHLKLFVCVVMESDVLRHFILRDSEARRLNVSIELAGLCRLQAEILEVINALRVDKLNVLTACATIGIAKHALHVIVIVFDRAANEVSLNKAFKIVRDAEKLTIERTHLVQTRR